MPMYRVHHQLHGRRGPRAGLILFVLSVWLTLGLVSQAAFQLIG